MTCDAVGGVWTYALDLAKALQQYNIEIIMAVMGPAPGRQQWEEISEISNVTAFAGGFKLEWMEDPWQDVEKAGRWLLDLESYHNPDVIHLNGFVHGSLPWQAPKIMVGHSCVLSWWEAVKKDSAPPSWDRYREEVRRGLRSADVVIAPSKNMLELLNFHYGPFPSGRVIPNGRSTELFCRRSKAPFIFSAGRIWDNAKNISALENVAPRLSWPVYAAGDEQHPNGKSAPLQKLRFLGRLSPEAIAERLALASIFALPARYEPFGLTVLEAAMSGCALVLGDIPSLREVWDDTALFVPPEDSNALEEALELFINNEAKRNDMAQHAYQRAQEFTADNMARAYVEVYRGLVRGGMKEVLSTEC